MQNDELQEEIRNDMSSSDDSLYYSSESTSYEVDDQNVEN